MLIYPPHAPPPTGPGPQPLNLHIAAALQELHPGFVHLAGSFAPAPAAVPQGSGASTDAHHFSWMSTMGPAYLRSGHYNEQDGTW